MTTTQKLILAQRQLISLHTIWMCDNSLIDKKEIDRLCKLIAKLEAKIIEEDK
jgi:hypothetical protein